MPSAATQQFARGFKSEANRLVTEVRRELGLGIMDRLLPSVLAEHLAIPLLPLSELASTCSAAVAHFASVEPSAFSAVTIFQGTRRLVVFNDGHHDGRQANSIVHELSHGILGHMPHAAIDHETGCRVWKPELEAEADFLAGALLVPDWAAVQIVKRGIGRREAAEMFGVSQPLITYRVNVTGARARAARMR